MIKETIGGVTRLIAEGSCKITNAERSFFSDLVYLGKNDLINNYEEVPRDIWKHFIEDPGTDFDILKERIDTSELAVINLEDVLLDTDFRLMEVEMLIEYGK